MMAQGRSHHFTSGGDGMSSVIPVFFSVNPCLIDRFLLNMLYDYTIIYDYKTERKKERKKEKKDI